MEEKLEGRRTSELRILSQGMWISPRIEMRVGEDAGHKTVKKRAESPEELAEERSTGGWGLMQPNAGEQNWAHNDRGRRAGLEANTRTRRPRVRREKIRGENSHQQGSCRGNWPQREPDSHQSKKKEGPSPSPHPEKMLRT